MKKLNRICSIILGCCLIPSLVQAQFTETREIHKAFQVAPGTRIEVYNKYGKVEINTWDKDSVVFDISVRVEEKKLSRLEKSIRGIDFDFTDSKHYLIARTSIGKNRSELEKEFLKFKETILRTEGNMEINYKIWLPSTNDLKVDNKFGDIYIGDYNGNIDISLSNGNLKSHDFRGSTTLNLSFADAAINSLGNGKLNCNFSELYIKEAESLTIDSKSSQFEILKLASLNAESRRDKFRIRLVDQVEARSSFSNFRLSELTDRLSLWTDYGDLDIERTAPDFGDIFIESKSTDINLYFAEDARFSFEITHSRAEVDLCRNAKVIEEIVLDEKDNKVKLTGEFGSTEEFNPKLHINASSGEINIMED